MLPTRSHPLQVLAVWTLLIAWVFLAGFNLSEQMAFVIDPNQYDEESLTLLEQALQRPSINKAPWPVFGGTVSATVSSVPFVQDIPRPCIRFSLHSPPSSSLNLYQLLSTYRI